MKSKRTKPTSVTNVLICGTGGQGVLLASDILAEVAMDSGFDVKKSEVHGMAQRGGSVVSHVRYGEKVHSPLIPDGAANVVLAFEKLEALRYLDFLKPGGSLIVNDIEIYPVPVAAGLDTYPENILEYLRGNIPSLGICDAVRIAAEVGNPRTANVVLLGVLARRLDLPQDKWIEVIRNHVPPKTIDVNIAAFHRGYGLS